jgi:hypothetical protein
MEEQLDPPFSRAARVLCGDEIVDVSPGPQEHHRREWLKAVDRRHHDGILLLLSGQILRLASLESL